MLAHQVLSHRDPIVFIRPGRADLTGFQPFHIMATDEGENWFDMERTHRVLGWRPTETFARLKEKTS